ncbi:MAG: DUF2065 domain-containing protein [Gammaproteobacteria bacterium HGW-Gammaproteobacteria-1]|jgi:hypothetical protein|nr:MAG: DUF2065 domain-containing protein [Gammaproteobacteria bacterium HGW-Gammaproteobacteria-1]
MWSDLWVALALLLVLEGVLPALSPRNYRKAMLSLVQLDDRSIRSAGLVLMVAGAVLVYWLKH